MRHWTVEQKNRQKKNRRGNARKIRVGTAYRNGFLLLLAPRTIFKIIFDFNVSVVIIHLFLIRLHTCVVWCTYAYIKHIWWFSPFFLLFTLFGCGSWLAMMRSPYETDYYNTFHFYRFSHKLFLTSWGKKKLYWLLYARDGVARERVTDWIGLWYVYTEI